MAASDGLFGSSRRMIDPVPLLKLMILGVVMDFGRKEKK